MDIDCDIYLAGRYIEFGIHAPVILREIVQRHGIPDHHPKYVVTTEENRQDNILDFLWQQKW